MSILFTAISPVTEQMFCNIYRMNDVTCPRSHSHNLAQYPCHSMMVISRTIINSNNNYYVSGTILNPLHVLAHLIFIKSYKVDIILTLQMVKLSNLTKLQ